MHSYVIRKRTVLLFLMLTGLLAYLNSFSVPFHYDDFHFLKEQLIIKSFPLYLDWITGHFAAVITSRAFLLFTFYLNYMVGGLDTFGYHLVNLSIHIAVAFTFYLLIARYVDNKDDDRYHAIALLAALFFVVHPINTESVTYISSRSSELSTLLILGTMLLFFRATEKVFSPILYGLAFLCFFLGLASKESAIVLPALLILFDYYFVVRKDQNFLSRIKFHLPLWAIMAAGFLYYAGSIAHPEMYDRPWPTHFLTEIKVFAEYLRLMIIPVGLTIDHSVTEATSFDLRVVLSMAVVAGLLLIAYLLRNKNRVLSFSILWFFINLTPFLAMRMSDYMTERWVYAAGLGFCLALSKLFVDASQRYIRTGIAAVIGISLCFGVLTIMRNEVYRDPITLWADAIKKAPEKSRPYTNLSASYLERGNIDKAISIMELSIKQGDRAITTYLNLAMAYYMKDDLQKAEKIMLTLKGSIPADIYAYNLGSIYRQKKEYRKAIETFAMASERNDYSPAVLGSMAECYKQLGDKKKAKEYYSAATQGIPQKPDDYLMVAQSYFELGDPEKGRESLNKALLADPMNIYIRNIIATTYLEKKNYNEAFKHFSMMSKISPGYAPAYTGLGQVLLGKGSRQEAEKYFRKALELLPQDSPDRKAVQDLLDRSRG
jgi:tetratricopeptide (TPR) repeat protein